MSTMKRTAFAAEVVWLGVVQDRDNTLASTELTSMELGFGGLEGEAHGGVTRPSCSRVSDIHPERGTEIRNSRQLSIVSAEELDDVAAAMGLSQLDPALIGASLVVRGLPDFSHVPPASRLRGQSGATLVVDMQNRPCHWPGKVIETVEPGKGRHFKAAAQGKRGVVASVERPGSLRIGDALTLFIPDQRAWRGDA
ncbi:MAG: MOSC domain-containing protein [Shimia sp.]